jgi:hypothetical protein
MKITLPENFGGRHVEMEDEELFDVDSPTPSVLSADAMPYHPTSSIEPVNLAIYNDGVPTMVLLTEADRYNLLHGIPDEAFDEGCFPLDAVDAAEIEATEAFVAEMANLAMLEEREEQARQSFNHIKKRWEVRRQSGPSVRGPRPAMNLIIPTERHVKTPPALQQQNAMMLYARSQRALEEKLRAKELLLASKNRMESRHSKSASSNKIRRPIQQPRKDS